jgi:hypothetical protein
MATKKSFQRCDERWEEIAAAYERGLSLAEISHHFECSMRLIRKILVNHGIPIRPARKAKGEVASVLSPVGQPN